MPEILVIKTKKDPFIICRRNETIFFEADDLGQSSDIPLRVSDACVTGALGDVALARIPKFACQPCMISPYGALDESLLLYYDLIYYRQMSNFALRLFVII